MVHDKVFIPSDIFLKVLLHASFYKAAGAVAEVITTSRPVVNLLIRHMIRVAGGVPQYLRVSQRTKTDPTGSRSQKSKRHQHFEEISGFISSEDDTSELLQPGTCKDRFKPERALRLRQLSLKLDVSIRNLQMVAPWLAKVFLIDHI